MNVYGTGLLITGNSGVGKSEAALELVKRGHQLVADDVVDIRRVSENRLIGEAPEYALEQWLRCDMLWPNLLTGAQYAHLQATLDAVQSQPDARSRNDALRNVFNSLMEDAIMTPLFKYNYRISAPPGVNGLRLNARGWFDFASAWLPASST